MFDKVSKEVILCFEIPKNLNSSYTLEISNGSKDWCDNINGNQFYDDCQSITKTIKSPTKTDYDEYKKKFILKNTDIKVNFNSIDLIEQKGFNILKIDFDVTNISSNEINYYSSNIFAITNEISYTSEKYDLTDLGYNGNECESYSIKLNPKLTKSYSYCFEVPQGNTVFDLAIRNGNFNSCDDYDCIEYVLNISNPNIVPLSQDPIPEPTPEYMPEQKQTTELEIPLFVDQSKDPQLYIDRYNNEPSYKDWFDENYPEYTIYEAVGLKEPQFESIIIQEPKVDQKPIDDTKCVAGTIMKDGFCIVDTSKQIESKTSSKGGGCLIATATYGSELSPQVQQLRELRDNSLLNTQSGTSFMNTFNDVYYSFSPIIADYERENPIFKETVKIALTPLISSLSILNYVDIDSEIEVLGYGISLILLNVGMYFVMPVVAIIGIKKQFLNVN